MSERWLGTERRSISGAARRHVLGLVFPFVTAASPRDVELERAFLQLAYAARRLSHRTSEACGYFAVVQQDVYAAVQRLHSRYEAGDQVRLVFHGLLVADMMRLTEAAEIASRSDDRSLLRAVAHEIAFETLYRDILSREPGVVERRSDPMPFGVDWDFYGTVPVVPAPSLPASGSPRRPAL